MNAPTNNSDDSELCRAVQQARFCCVLGLSPMGESSLRIRTSRQLEQDGYRCATVVLTIR